MCWTACAAITGCTCIPKPRRNLRPKSGAMLAGFYTDTDDWKEQILVQGRDAMVQAADGLAA